MPNCVCGTQSIAAVTAKWYKSERTQDMHSISHLPIVSIDSSNLTWPQNHSINNFENKARSLLPPDILLDDRFLFCWLLHSIFQECSSRHQWWLWWRRGAIPSNNPSFHQLWMDCNQGAQYFDDSELQHRYKVARDHSFDNHSGKRFSEKLLKFLCPGFRIAPGHRPFSVHFFERTAQMSACAALMASQQEKIGKDLMSVWNL